MTSEANFTSTGAGHEGPYAYCTLVTRASYLAGVIALGYSLRKQGSQYPLIVLYTPNLPASSVKALELESTNLNLILYKTTALLPRENIHVNLIAARFADTWTKLRVFQLHEPFPQFTELCYLDADMVIFNPLDSIFTLHPLPGKDWIGANHACVCNLKKDAWAPSEWNADNCAYTPLKHPSALTHPTPVTSQSRPTHHLLNSGMFLYHPSPSLWESMLSFFNTTPLLSEFKFPDQDFLAEFFRNRWMSVGWQYNAIKTMRYWHENIWRDDAVVVLHYIVDKPWARRNNPDGTAGFLGEDGETHSWWWKLFEEWRANPASEESLKAVEEQCDTGEEGREMSQDMKDIGSETQKMANAWPKDKKDGTSGNGKAEVGQSKLGKAEGTGIKGGEGLMPN